MFGIAVSPVSGVVSIGGSEFADRYSYLPSLFLITGCAFALALTAERFPESRAVICIAAALAAIFFIAEVRLNCELYRDEMKFQESALAVRDPHYRILYSYGHRLLLERRYAEAEALADSIKTPRGATAQVAGNIDVFRRTLRAVSMIYLGNVDNGLQEFDKVVFSKDCACLKVFSYNFAKDTLSLGAKLHLQKGNTRQAAHIFGILSDLYGDYDPAERDFFLGVRAMILRDYRAAVNCFERAYQVRPDERIKANLQEALRRLK
jgi:tetratricopeptide (TPR) repeat protein